MDSILPLSLEDVGLDLAGTTRVSAVSCRFEEQGCSVILGPNGAGKTLLLRLMNGLVAPTRGRIRWLGAGAARAAEARGMVFQRPVMLRRSVAANVAYGLAVRGVHRAARAERVAAALAATGLAERAAFPARRLSVGEQQRLAIARVWALEPQVVLLDEPAASQDPTATRRLEETIRALASSGTKVIMTTHDLAQARRMADEVLFVHRGRLLEQSAASAFFGAPRCSEARSFLAGELLS